MGEIGLGNGKPVRAAYLSTASLNGADGSPRSGWMNVTMPRIFTGDPLVLSQCHAQRPRYCPRPSPAAQNAFSSMSKAIFTTLSGNTTSPRLGESAKRAVSGDAPMRAGARFRERPLGVQHGWLSGRSPALWVADGAGYSPRSVSTVLKGFGLRVHRDRDGAYVEFEPKAWVRVAKEGRSADGNGDGADSCSR